MSDRSDPRHPHEPEVPPTFDDDGRCLVCRGLFEATEQGFDRALAVANRTPLWLLVGDLDQLEYAMSDYFWKWGQHLPGVKTDTTAGTPVAFANMAMSVIRRNIRRIEPPRPPDQLADPRDVTTNDLAVMVMQEADDA